MAKNTDNKRIAVKHVRDKAKSAYEKKSACHICGTNQDLELHHTHSITLLLNAWALHKEYDISTDDGILAVREEFIRDYHKEIYEDVYTLCNKHHVALHAVYGKAPSLSSASRQGDWIAIQKAKYEGGSSRALLPSTIIAPFAEFYEQGLRSIMPDKAVSPFAQFYRGIS